MGAAASVDVRATEAELIELMIATTFTERENLLGVVMQISDDGIDLRDADFHRGVVAKIWGLSLGGASTKNYAMRLKVVIEDWRFQ